MSVPDYQTIMLPFLEEISDGNPRVFKDIVDALAKKFDLNEDDLNELLPSGQGFLFPNRVGWARTYLKKACLIEAPKRGTVIISDRGTNVLKSQPKKIDNYFLSQFPEFIRFQNPKPDNEVTETVTSPADIGTPEELIETSYQKIRQSLAQELLETVKRMSPIFFEKLVVELLVKMGYGGSLKDAGSAVGKTGDEGIDGTIKEDKLGLDIIYIQAKRWQTANIVGRPELQRFVGALAGQGAKKGVFITTSSFSKDALSYMPRNETKIVLIDGERLAQLMIDYNLGVSMQRLYEIKRIDSDYFEES